MLRCRVVIDSSKLPEDTIRHVWTILLAYPLVPLSDHMVLIWVIVTALGSVGQFETLTEDNILETEQMARFHVELGNGEKVVIEAEAVDNVPEFVRELKEHGYVTGRKEGGEVVALIDPHVAVVRLMRAD